MNGLENIKVNSGVLPSTMVFAEDIRRAILALADQRGSGNLFYPAEVARLIDAEDWAKQVDQVELVAESLIQEGQLVAERSGKPGIAYSKSPQMLETN